MWVCVWGVGGGKGAMGIRRQAACSRRSEYARQPWGNGKGEGCTCKHLKEIV